MVTWNQEQILQISSNLLLIILAWTTQWHTLLLLLLCSDGWYDTTPRVACRVCFCLVAHHLTCRVPGPLALHLHAALCCAWQRQTAGRTCQVSLADRQVRSQVATDLTDAVTVRTCRLLLQKIRCSAWFRWATRVADYAQYHLWAW
jgi:hypothetical protein